MKMSFKPVVNAMIALMVVLVISSHISEPARAAGIGIAEQYKVVESIKRFNRGREEAALLIEQELNQLATEGWKVRAILNDTMIILAK